MTHKEALKIAKPILFNTEMVRAIQNGTKTVTRRVIKPRFRKNECGFFTATIAGQLFLYYSDEEDEETRSVKLPYQVGDILYVRETWSPVSVNPKRYLYKTHCPEADNLPVKWHPSIHMPKEIARIFLRVTNIKVERLQDIDEIGVINEGAEPLIRCPHEHIEYYSDGQEMCWNVLPCAVECDKPYPKLFGELVWNETVKKSDLNKYGWAANPWVLVIEFERAEVTE